MEPAKIQTVEPPIVVPKKAAPKRKRSTLPKIKKKKKRNNTHYRVARWRDTRFRPLNEVEKKAVRQLHEKLVAVDPKRLPLYIDRTLVAYVRQGRWLQFTVAIVGHPSSDSFLVGVSRRDKRDSNDETRGQLLALAHAFEGNSHFTGPSFDRAPKDAIDLG